MRKISGIAMISIRELDDLRQNEEKLRNLRKNMKSLIKDINTDEYNQEIKKINEANMGNEEYYRSIKAAQEKIKIIISEEKIRKLIYGLMFGEEESECNYTIDAMTEEEFEKITLILSQEKANTAAVQK